MLSSNEQYIFETYDSKYLSKNGMTATIKRTLLANEVDIIEVGNMYEVVLEDGTELQAFEDELKIPEHVR
jgi:hypothetical protein